MAASESFAKFDAKFWIAVVVVVATIALGGVLVS